MLSMALGPILLFTLLLAGHADSPNFAPLIGNLAPSVAFILSRDEGGAPIESGSAFVVGPDGLLVTTLHILDEAYQISAQFSGQEPRGAYVIGVDIAHDLALLVVANLPRPAPPGLALADSAGVALGQRIIVLGFPLASPQDLTLTATQGTVTALQGQGGDLQFDAAVNPGESGAPLVAPSGEVIGVVGRSVRGAQNVNFAVPSDAVRALIARSPSGDFLHLPPNLPFSLPLTSGASVVIEYSSGSVSHGPLTRLGVRCVAPPAHAAVLDKISVALQAGNALHVVTWLSWAKGEPAESPASFAQVDATTTHRLAGVLPVHLQPDLVCLNFQAWNNTAVRIGVTFTVQYTLDYRVFKDSVLSAAQR
jgi:S1-C subfamily serine protease